MARLEEQLTSTQEDIQKVAVVIPLPQTPTKPVPVQPTGRPPVLPLFPKATTEPAKASSAIPGLRTPEKPAGSAGGGGPPRRPRRPAVSPSPSPPPSSESINDEDLYERNLPTGKPPPDTEEPSKEQLATMLTSAEIARLVGAGIAAARAPE